MNPTHIIPHLAFPRRGSPILYYEYVYDDYSECKFVNLTRDFKRCYKDIILLQQYNFFVRRKKK